MHPPRVVSLDPAITEIVCGLGCGDWLVGRSHACDHPAWVHKLPAVTRADPAARVDSAAREIDADRLAALRADEVLSPCECASLADLWREFRRIADRLGVPERGVQLVTRTAGRLRAIGERAAALAQPRIAFIESVDPLAAGGRWMPEVVALAGGEDLFGKIGEPAPRLAWDTLRTADPDVVWIALRNHEQAGTRAAFETLATRPGWGGLGAVRGARVFGGDGHALFHRPGPRVAESLEALTEALHPAAFRFGHEGRGWERLSAGLAPARSTRRG